MRKQITLTLILLAAAFAGFAKQAEQTVIRQVAVGFFYDHARLAENLSWNSVGIRKMTPTVLNGHTLYYTLTMNPRGWIVVAADDAITPVLAYSFEDNMNSASLPPQFIAWMGKYQKEINDAVSRNLPQSGNIAATWARYAKYDPNQPLAPETNSGVAPLIIHNWDQGFPYNIYCPLDPAGPGNHPWAGCVATAMSQIMYYYRFPQTGNGQHCYNPSGYPQQCANYGTSTYDWNAMVNTLSGTRLHSDSAVALLIWHAGVSVDMMYSPSGSGAYSEDARNALVSNFRYSPGATYLQRDNYSITVWEGMLRDNLDKKMPIYYDGYGPQGGHAFNCDGYQDVFYYHFNWGWSGTANGYYYLDNLNPGGDNFSQGEGAILNIFPDTLANTYPYPCQVATPLTSISGTFGDGSGPVMNYKRNSQCSWLLAPQSAEDSVKNITLTFNSFSTVADDGILRIYKGINTDDSLVGQYSGNGLPPNVTINGSRAFITFSSGSSATAPGFLISYSGQVMDWCKDAITIGDANGTISDGSLHFNYHNGTTCRWRIVPQVNSGPLSLSFTSFRTQHNKDVVSIYDNVSGVLLGEYSGIYSGTTMPPSVIAPSGQMFIIFSTDASVTDSGWEAMFSSGVGISEPDYASSIEVYPNPANRYLFVKTTREITTGLQLELNDINGRTVLSRKAAAGVNQVTIDISGIRGGLYFLKIITDSHSVVKKVVVE